MQRNGYARQAAVSWLAPMRDPLALRLLLLRLNDVVSNVTTAAMDAVRDWLDVRRADAIVAALPLLETMTRTVRAAHSGIAERAQEVLALSNPATVRALLAAARASKDEDVRRLAILRLAGGSDEQAIEAVRLGLDDRSPRVRLATGRWLGAARRSVVVRAAVAPLLEHNPSPTLRLLAVRIRRSDASEEAHRAVLARCLDGNVVVRFAARCQMRERGDGVDFRALALERLAEGSERDELVGALAVLSDIGRREDIETVRRFLEHPLRRVAAEAERTLGILELG
jgi:HEAT repeat protein